MRELPFYNELSVVKKSNAFKGYARSYKIELIESKDPLVQSEANISSIKGLFNYLLNGMKGFKYQITMTVLLYNHKMDGDTEYSPVLFFFNSVTETVIIFEYCPDKSFQEIIGLIKDLVG